MSGSRVRATFYDGGEGAILFGGWFDSELGVGCTFVRTRDGAMRCLPAGQPAVWMDATCTMPVWRAEFRESLPLYVTAWLSQGAAAYERGEPYTGAVRETGNVTWGWQRSCLQSLDGFIDAQADVPSRPVRFAVGLRCVPWRVAHLTSLGPYLDAGCTTLLSESRPGSWWGPATTGAPAVAMSDGSVSTAYTLGDVVTPAVVYFKRSTCEPRTPVAGAVYRPATPAGDGQWAPVVERVE